MHFGKYMLTTTTMFPFVVDTIDPDNAMLKLYNYSHIVATPFDIANIIKTGNFGNLFHVTECERSVRQITYMIKHGLPSLKLLELHCTNMSSDRYENLQAHIYRDVMKFCNKKGIWIRCFTHIGARNIDDICCREATLRLQKEFPGQLVSVVYRDAMNKPMDNNPLYASNVHEHTRSELLNLPAITVSPIVERKYMQLNYVLRAEYLRN